MVNILIHQFLPAGAVVDEGALEQFQKQWAGYQKLVDTDALSTRATARILKETLRNTFAQPFSLLDIACGDASTMREALPGTGVRHYHGIDLSEPALELAAANLKDMPFEVELDHEDFVEAVTRRPEPADAAWCSLSVHHLQTDGKRDLLAALHASTRDFVMIYEPTRLPGESREAYLARFRRVNETLWSMLTREEWAQIDHHVTTSDYPETPESWLELGREAGFSKAAEIFVDPTGFYRLYHYRH
jgi:hypothetical protein